METYVSYYTFFSDTAKLIKDVSFDFEAEHLSGSSFDKAYSSFMNKLIGRCHSFAGNTFRGSSKVISNYITDLDMLRNQNDVQGKRFGTLLHLTDTYMRRSV